MDNDLIAVDPLLLAKWNRPVPRYTSYPTAPQFYPVDEEIAFQKLLQFDRAEKPLSLYIHIPFCKTMCLFCGCSVVLNRKPERQTAYLNSLFKEIALIARNFTSKRRVSQLHLGGGTPTSLSEREFEQLMKVIQTYFTLTSDAEVSIEIDPRTVYADGGAKLQTLKKLGFNRVSFGVQDLDPAVQEAVKRRQSEEMTVQTYLKAREIGFDGINIDLIYGLPFQTPQSFSLTAEKLLQLKPDRIAFYSYAKVPWLKSHQKAIPEETLPSTEEKFQIYVETRASFMKGGYAAIGMDHFSLLTDPMVESYRAKKLMRNFQGYSVQSATDMIGLGLSSIGFLENTYFQNFKELAAYQESLEKGHLPIQRGFVLSEEDQRRRCAIQSIMCQFELEKTEFDALGDAAPLLKEGFLEIRDEKYIATPLGRLFVRLIAVALDAYVDKGQFSSAV